MRPAVAFRAARSKKGAAMALVIVMTTAMLILVAALLAAANFNVDYTSRGVQGRQAYLSAKSAVEYARAYAAARKDDELGTLAPADTLYVIAKNGALTTDGFDVVKNAPPERLEGKAYASISLTPDTAAAAGTTSTEQYILTIRGSAPQLDQKSAKSLGYQCNLTRATVVTPPTPAEPSGGSQNGFVSAGNIAAQGQNPFTELTDAYEYVGNKRASLVYPLVFGDKMLRTTGAGGEGQLTAPQIYLLYSGSTDVCIQIEQQQHLTLSADFIFYNGSRLNRTGDSTLSLTAQDGSGATILYFSKACTIDFSPIVVSEGYYRIPPKENIFGFTSADWDSYRLDPGSEEYQAAERQNQAGKDGSLLINAISAERHGGWVSGGGLKQGSPNNSNLTWYNSPNFGTGSHVFCYVSSADGWGIRDGSRFSYMTYSAQSMFWNYTAESDWVFPGIPITFQAPEAVSFSTQNAITDPTAHPSIEASSVSSEFIIRTKTLYVYNSIQILSKTGNQTYELKPGTYTLADSYYTDNKGFNLFAPNMDAFFDKVYGDGEYKGVSFSEELPGASSGSGGTGGDPGSIVTTVELTDGRYTDG